MFTKAYNKKLCLFSILILLLWGPVSGTASVSEIADNVCGETYSYVNRTVPGITQAGRHIPAQEYLSARHASPQESVSTARGRNIRPLARTIRHIAADLLYHGPFAASFAVSGQMSYQKIPSYSPCGIIITNYIHQKDGRKS